MSVTQRADLFINFLGLGLLLWLSAITIVRWIRAGRVESYASAELMPKWLPRWARGILAVVLLIPPAAPCPIDSSAERSTRGGVTRWGWLFFGCIAVWLITKAF